MPWLAQHVGGHPHYVDEGSQLERVYRHIGYVDVPAPGADGQVAEPEPEPDRDDFGEPLPHFDPTTGVDGTLAEDV